MMLEFSVADMTCSNCAGTITNAIKAVDPQASVEVNLETRSIRVDTASAAEDIGAAITKLGYTPVVPPPSGY